MNHHTVAATAVVAFVLFTLPYRDVQARIVCDGDFQAVHGLAVATPYCREQNLARVARGYGMRVSAESIRYSESAKADICRAIGHDNRVREICAPYRIDGGSRFRN